MANSNGNTAIIPVIDISGEVPELEVATQLVNAATKHGFVYIKNEGKDIPIEAIDNLFQLSKDFFDISTEEKQPYTITENNRGWSGMHSETLDAKNQRIGDFKEAMNFGEFVDGKAQQPLPPILAQQEEILSQFHDYCHDLMLKLLTLFAIGLDIDKNQGGSSFFSSRHTGGPSGCTLRLLHYPSIAASPSFDPEIDIRAGAHSDYGTLTLLFQRPGQPGLEILPPSSSPDVPSKWTPVPVNPPTTENDASPPILINIGDLLSHWTNNLFKSTVHRVVFPKPLPGQITQSGGEDRYSIAYFGHPVGTTVLEPVPSKLVREAGEKLAKPNGEGQGAEKLTADAHLMSRLKASYLSMYKEESK